MEKRIAHETSKGERDHCVQGSGIDVGGAECSVNDYDVVSWVGTNKSVLTAGDAGNSTANARAVKPVAASWAVAAL
jgi:hypothetical protein